MNNSTAGSRMRGTVPRSAALACAVVLLLTSCTGAPEVPGPTDTSQTSPPTMAPSPTTAPLREARSGWKVFSDPGRLLSFELPETWRVQTVQTEPDAYPPGSLHYAVRTEEGFVAAELHTDVVVPETPCEQWERTPYHVIGSDLLEQDGGVTESDGSGPRFVTRLITGFRFFGSYGITDQVGGDDGLACVLPNTVRAGEPLGRVSFGDLVVLEPKAPADTGPGTVSFGTIGEAEEYYASDHFAVIGDVIRSLRFSEDVEAADSP